MITLPDKTQVLEADKKSNDKKSVYNVVGFLVAVFHFVDFKYLHHAVLAYLSFSFTYIRVTS